MADIGDVLLRIQGNADDVIGTSIWDYAVGVALRDVVFITSADTVDKAVATGDPAKPAIGIVTQLDFPTSGECVVRHLGFVSGFSGLTPGKAYIISRNAGVLVASDGGTDYPQAGDFKQTIGIAKNSTTLQVQVDPTTFEVN